MQHKAQSSFHYQQHTAAYLFNGVKETNVAVHHDHHRDDQAEYEETDDIRCGLSWLWWPAYWTACTRAFYPVTAPTNQRWHSPDQGINPWTTDGQQCLPVISVALVAQGESAVAFIGQDSQGDQGHNACNEPSNLNVYFHNFVQHPF